MSETTQFGGQLDRDRVGLVVLNIQGPISENEELARAICWLADEVVLGSPMAWACTQGNNDSRIREFVTEFGLGELLPREKWLANRGARWAAELPMVLGVDGERILCICSGLSEARAACRAGLMAIYANNGYNWDGLKKHMADYPNQLYAFPQASHLDVHYPVCWSLLSFCFQN